MADVIRVAVTGAAGQVAYAMLGRLASGEVFGPNKKVILQLLDIPQQMGALEGVAMELDDCSFPTLQDVIVTDDPNKAFKDCNWALLVGSFPRKQGMERKELLGINGKIFVGQGKALAQNAARDVRVLVVGNPCNSNCLVAYHNGRDVPADRWTAMTRLDHNRARSALARKAGVANEADLRLDILVEMIGIERRMDDGLSTRHLDAEIGLGERAADAEDHIRLGEEFRHRARHREPARAERERVRLGK